MNRRTLLLAAATPLASAALLRPALAQPAPAAPPPILFIHGNGDHSALWTTTLWRFESNGFNRDSMAALDLENPLARDDDAVAQPLRSSSAEFLQATARAITALRRRTGAARVALVGNSRGGYPIRNHVLHNNGAAEVSHAVLCGTPNHGVWSSAEWRPNSEFNAQSAFLRKLNGGSTDVAEGTAFLTLRSDGYDLYAQPDGRYIGRAGMPTGVDAAGPEMRGATNLVLPGLDHRETAYSPRAFREMHRFITGAEPSRLDIMPEGRPVLNGRVTGTPGGVQTNKPLAGAVVEVHRVDAAGLRMGPPVLKRQTRGDGVWGPVTVGPDWHLEFVVSAADLPTTHFYRQPFPRSSNLVHLRPARPLAGADLEAAGVVLFTRPRAYFGMPRDVVLLDGREPDATQVPRGVPASATVTARLSAQRLNTSIAGLFNQQRLVGRVWPVAEGHIAVLELN
jgi:pimeloyl-ACP methyl ester carboxylesterase